MKQTLKAKAVTLGIAAACWLAVEALTTLMWVAYYAGMTM